MYDKANPLFLLCESPLHAGSGSGLGIVDLPIQREKHTGFPKIEGSSLKGSLREFFETKYGHNGDDNEANTLALFGSDSDAEEGKSQAGAMGVSDARLLLFPVKSMKGVFAWITCPRVLHRFKEDYELSGEELGLEIPPPGSVAPGSNLLLAGQRVVLEEYAFKEVQESEAVSALGEWLAGRLYDGQDYWSEKLKQDIFVLGDEDFQDFANLSTEVITRTKISSETGTVEPGALFTEEYLPSDALLYSVIFTRGEFQNKDKDKEAVKAEEQLRTFFADTLNESPILQLGGNYTLGKGVLRTKYLNL